MARGFATPIRSPAARCCRPWVQVWQCCPKVLKASDTGRQKGRFLSASKAAVRQMWTVADLNGAPRTFSSSPHGSVTRTTRQKSRCCSRFLTARRRKRSVSGANKAERARLRRATWASDSSSRLAIRIFVCLRARSSFAPTEHSLRSCPASRSAPQSAANARFLIEYIVVRLARQRGLPRAREARNRTASKARLCDGRCCTKKQAHQGLGSRDRHGNPCPGQFRCQIVFRRFH